MTVVSCKKIQNFCFTSPKVLYSCQSRSNNFFWKTNQWTILIFLKKFNAILKSCQNRKMCTLSRSYKRATKSQVINSSFFTLTGRPGQAAGRFYMQVRSQPWLCPPLRSNLTFPSFADAISFFCLCNPIWLAHYSKLQPVKIKQFFGTGIGYAKVKKKTKTRKFLTAK